MTADDVARDLCAIIDDVPVVFTFSEVEYQGTRGQLVNARRQIEGGYFDAPELTITTCMKKVNGSGKLMDRFPADGEPGERQVLTSVGGETGADYRVVRTVRDEWGMGLQLDLESVNK